MLITWKYIIYNCKWPVLIWKFPSFGHDTRSFWYLLYMGTFQSALYNSHGPCRCLTNHLFGPLLYSQYQHSPCSIFWEQPIPHMPILVDNLMLHDFHLWKLLKLEQLFPQSNTYNKNHKGKATNCLQDKKNKNPFVIIVHR